MRIMDNQCAPLETVNKVVVKNIQTYCGEAL